MQMQNLYKLPKYYQYLIEFMVDTSREVKILDSILKKNRRKKILDVACGTGRHAISLAKLGYKVTAFDLSPYQINKAKKDAKRAKAKVEFYIKDANTFNFARRKFDAAICMWSTLGEEPLMHKEVIKNIYNALTTKGMFVIDNDSWEYIPKSGEDIITRTFSNRKTRISQKIYDRYTEHFRIRDVIYSINGDLYKDLILTRTLKTEEWLNELRDAGFKKFEVYKDYRKQSAQKPHRILIVAKK